MFDFTGEFTLKGKWWIPGDDRSEKDGLYGELNFSPTEGLELTVEGSLFQTKSVLKAKHNFRLPCLFGIIKERHFITLFNILGREVGQDSWITTELSIEYGLSNTEGYFATKEMPVNGINFNTNSLSAFFKGYRKTLQFNHRESGVSFDYEEVPLLTVIKNKVDAYFYFRYQFKGLGMVADEFSFVETIYLNVFFTDEPTSLEDVIGKLNFYRDFFTFFSTTKVSFRATNIFTKNNKDESVKFAFLFKDASHSGFRVSALDILLSYQEVETIFSSIFQHWYDNEKIIQSGLLLYLQTKYLKFPSHIQSFLNMVFAIETLHNTYFDRKIFLPEDSKKFKDQKKIALNCFDENFQAKVLDCLSHFNSVTFSDRLKDLIKRNHDLLNDFIYDVDDFCRRVKLQRNFLAHNHSEAEKTAIESNHYPYFIAMLKLIFECSFLPVLGISPELIKLSIKRNFSYQRFRLMIPEIKKELLG